MAEDDEIRKLSTPEPSNSAEPSVSKPRKKRRWDQPDDCLISSGVVTSGFLSMPIVGYSLVCLPGIMPTSAALTQAPVMPLQAAAAVQKLNQMQEDLVIAREIVINDADPAMRYKLTKRQTQEEIQKCTGAVVITRGKYRPPNAIPDGEKPLYLHISSGGHLKETVERVLAVDRAAAMVEDMLKQATQPLSTCVYVGFDADPSLNIAARIRGPNDQYINHIINETGATVALRGHRSGYLSDCEEGPLHLLLSSNNQKSLEDARLLAENLLDTISRECGATRVSSCKLYGAVPPPQQLLVGVQSSGLEMHSNLSTTGSLACSVATTVPGISDSLVVTPIVPSTLPFGQGAETGRVLPSSCSQTNRLLYSEPLPTTCTSYSAYAGIYPQLTPLQQVALALKQSSTVTSAVDPVPSAIGMAEKSSLNVEKRPPQRRKFQEAPATSIITVGSQQGAALHVPVKCSSIVDKKIGAPLPRTSLKTQQSPTSPHASTSCPYSRSMPPPPPSLPSKLTSPTPSSASRSMPPPKATSSLSVNGVGKKDNVSNMPNLTSVPVVSDTLIKLMEYGDDDNDDDDEEANENVRESVETNHNRITNGKPFWAA